MYPILRLAHITLTGHRAPKIRAGEVVERRMTCWPWDCDVFIEMNNGRHLTLYDLGRFDYGARCGLISLLRERGWGLVVAGSTIRYRKRLLPFQRFTMTTRLVARDDRWFYFVQGMWRDGECCSSALIRTAVTAKGKVLPTQEVAVALEQPDWRPEPPEWVARWIGADDLRPWPPEE